MIHHYTTTSHTAPDTLDRAESWRPYGTCAAPQYVGHEDLWFPEPGDTEAVRAAVRVCESCPVLALCRQAVAVEEHGIGKASRYGIRAGLTPVQRWAADTSTRAAQGKGGRQLSPCGTNTAYDRHVRRGEPVDTACRKAHAEHSRAQRERERHRPRRAVPDGCGTTRAYYRHIQAGEPIDEACQAASDAYEQQLTVPPGPPECGTRGGYARHLRKDEPACTPCRQANTDASRRLRTTGTTTERSAA
ncbi:hypothetical protein B7C62_28195 [Kitasatospora albolonga]|uniref:4Fe-4S Wbl-type domain-containing protein n=1 Tax=Kitasatospora albolonga TaxID=68173 RepID=A0ABC8C1B7_9ACTN|nr:hypothetical protein B7C62_28195 [Kitasatospora albolonga]